jgi:hypothetical protein
MKNDYKKIVLSAVLGLVGSSAFALDNTKKDDLFATNNVTEEIVAHCTNIFAGLDEKSKSKEAQKCIFVIDQQIKTEQLNAQLKTIKHDKESILGFDLSAVKTNNLLIKTIENLRKAMLLPEGKTQEFERISILYKDPNLDIKEKEKQAKSYYKQFDEKNYKVNKEVYESFKELNNKLIAQKEVVVKIENELMQGFPDKEKEKLLKRLNRDFSKEININNEILKSYDNYIMARKLEAQNALTKIVEGKKIKLSKNECKLLDTMYYKYEVNTFKNLSCK